MFQEELAKIPSTLYVLKEVPGKKVLGYSCFWSLSGEVQLVNIAVHPDLRGKGLGRRLLNHLLLEAESREAEKIFSGGPAFQSGGYRALRKAGI